MEIRKLVKFNTVKSSSYDKLIYHIKYPNIFMYRIHVDDVMVIGDNVIYVSDEYLKKRGDLLIEAEVNNNTTNKKNWGVLDSRWENYSEYLKEMGNRILNGKTIKGEENYDAFKKSNDLGSMGYCIRVGEYWASSTEEVDNYMKQTFTKIGISYVEYSINEWMIKMLME